MAQELSATLEERIQAFHRQIKRVAEINMFEIVGNMDETPLFFDAVPGRVLDKKGKRSVVVRTTGNQKRQHPPSEEVSASGCWRAAQGCSQDNSLILDSFSAHITPAIKERLNEINTVPVVIPCRGLHKQGTAPGCQSQ